MPCHALAIPFCALKAQRGEKGILSNLFSSSWRDEILHSAKHLTEKCAVCSVRLCGKDRGARREGAERASEAAPARPPGAKCMLEYFKT